MPQNPRRFRGLSKPVRLGYSILFVCSIMLILLWTYSSNDHAVVSFEPEKNASEHFGLLTTEKRKQVVSSPKNQPIPAPGLPTVATLLRIKVISRLQEPCSGAVVSVIIATSREMETPYSVEKSTDEQGIVSFESLPFDRYLVSAVKDGQASQVSVTLTQEEPAQFLSLILSPAGVLKGKVLDMSRHPIPGANVSIFEKNYGSSPDIQTVAGYDGAYEFIVLPYAFYKVKAMAPGYAPGFSSVVTPGAESADIVLERGGRISGTVRAEGDEKAISYLAVCAMGLSDGKVPTKATTDVNGKFELIGLATDTYSIYVEDSQYIMTTTEPKVDILPGRSVTDVEVQVSVGGRIAGKVVSATSGNAVPDVAVSSVVGETLRFVSSTTNNNGEYSIGPILPGEANIVFTRGGITRQELYSVPAYPEVGVGNFEWPESATVSGKVVDADGHPVFGAIVIVWAPNGEFIEWRVETRSNSEGYFELTNCQPYEGARIQAFSEDLESAVSAPFKIATRVEDIELKLRSALAASVSGFALDEQSKPALARVRFKLLNPKPDELKLDRDTFSDADGFFLLNGLRPGEYDVWVGPYDDPQSVRSPDQSMGTITLREAERRQNLVLTLDMSAGIDGTVFDENGNSVPFAVVVLLDAEDPEFHRVARTDAMGYFALRSVPEGVFVLQAEKETVGHQRLLGLTSGQTVEVVLSLSGGLEGIDPGVVTVIRPF